MSCRLDGRLAAVAALVRPGSRVADIGTDHGLLMVHLLQSGRAAGGYACDLREKPLAAARRAVAAAGFADRIHCIQADGLDALSSGMADDIVMAGMGGELIARLIERAPWLRDGALRLILQPMTRPEALRRFLCAEGFEILAERAASAGGREYTVMLARWDGMIRPCDALFAWTGKLPEDQSPEASAYLLRLRRIVERQTEGLSAGGDAEAARKRRALCDRLDAMLKGRK